MTKQLIFFSPYWWPTIDEDIKTKMHVSTRSEVRKDEFKSQTNNYIKENVTIGLEETLHRIFVIL